jgi:hypothetical protein
VANCTQRLNGACAVLGRRSKAATIHLDKARFLGAEDSNGHEERPSQF